MLVSPTSTRSSRAQPATAGSPEIPAIAPATPAPATPVSKSYRGAHSGRLLSLDMLRGLAILLVLGRHTVAPVEGLGWFQPVVATWTRIGWSGVDLFFVLSGFLVSGLIFSEYRQTGGVDIRRFVIRRGFKIWPPYLVYIGFVACWLAWKHRHGAGPGVWEQLWPNLFHVQNYFGTPRVHTWSLAVEEHFYLAVAIAFYWILSRGHVATMLRRFPLFVAFAVVGLAALRTFAFLRHGSDFNIYATHLRFDGLLIGTLLAYISHFEPQKLERLVRHPVALMVGGLIIAAPTLALAPEANVWTAGIGLTGVYVGYGMFLLGWLNLPNTSRWGRRLFSTRPAAWLGGIGFFSYSIYLWHIDLAQTPLHKVALKAAEHGWAPGAVYATTTAVYVVLAFAFGSLMARLLERPSIALRNRLFPSGVNAVAAGVRPRGEATGAGSRF